MEQHSAWHNDTALKQRFVAAAAAHREADRYLQGTYAGFEDGHFVACSVGCSLATVYGDTDPDAHNYGDHQLLAEKLGVPVFITRMQDRIFEGLPEESAIAWTERLFSAIPVGADLSPVHPLFLLALQRRSLGMIDREAFPDVYDAISDVIAVLDEWGKTGEVNASAARSAESAARSAAESARSAAESARSAARSAAWSAWSAESAAESAWSAAWSAAGSNAYRWMADTLIRLIEDSEESAQ